MSSTSIFGLAGNQPLNATGSVLIQEFIANSGQVLFSLTSFSYVLGSNSLWVYINDSKQWKNIDYLETSSTSFTLSTPLLEGDKVYAVGFPLVKLIKTSNIVTTSDDISYTYKGSNTTVRSLTAKLNEIVSIEDFGGAAIPGADNSLALQIALDYASLLGSRYDGGTIQINAFGGLYEFHNTVDITAANNICIKGGGRGVTTFKFTENLPLFNSVNVSSLPLFRFILADITLYGPGASNTLANAIRLGANNNCSIFNVNIFAARRAISLTNSFNTDITNCRINGLGGLACYDGIYLEDGDPSVVENAISVYGGQIHGCERYGLRGESVTGSKIFGLEILGCNSTGVYLGDSPTSKELKWFTWVGGLVDTCPDLIKVSKGSSTVAELLHFSGLWLGYAYDSTGTGVEFIGISNSTFSSDITVNCTYAADFLDCTNLNVQFDTIKDYDRGLTGAVAIIVRNTSNSRFILGSATKTATSPSSIAIEEQTTSTNNVYIGGVLDGLLYTIPGNGSRTAGTRHNESGTSQILPDILRESTVANLPPASTYWKGRNLMVTDEVGGYTMAICDGVNWRRMQDRNIVS